MNLRVQMFAVWASISAFLLAWCYGLTRLCLWALGL